ncbi:MAG TPA: hypothetical protein VME17_15815 [Bryobacteraceae bacterium]|nr:hypothetical protein [Bryobacteraceae bacterium]
MQTKLGANAFGALADSDQAEMAAYGYERIIDLKTAAIVDECQIESLPGSFQLDFDPGGLSMLPRGRARVGHADAMKRQISGHRR